MTSGGMWSRVWHYDDAQDIAEYAVLFAVVLIIVVATATAMGMNAHLVWSKVCTVFGQVAK